MLADRLSCYPVHPDAPLILSILLPRHTVISLPRLTIVRTSASARSRTSSTLVVPMMASLRERSRARPRPPGIPETSVGSACDFPQWSSARDPRFLLTFFIDNLDNYKKTCR